MKKLIYIIHSIFNKRDYHRFGIEILIKRGYDVNIWDFSPLFRPKYFNNYSPPDPINFEKQILIHNKDDAIKLIEKLSSQDVAICLLGIDVRNEFIFTHLSKNNVKYGFISAGQLPTMSPSLLSAGKKVLQNSC